MNFKGLIFGIPREILSGERRIAVIPETVRKLTGQNAVVLIEKNAGDNSYYSNNDYREAGAEIIDDVEDIYNKSDMILKVKEPMFNEKKEKHEVQMMRKGQYLLSAGKDQPSVFLCKIPPCCRGFVMVFGHDPACRVVSQGYDHFRLDH